MSEAAARAERRAIRRVLGPELVSVVEDTTQAIRVLQQGQAAIRAELAGVTAAVEQQPCERCHERVGTVYLCAVDGVLCWACALNGERQGRELGETRLNALVEAKDAEMTARVFRLHADLCTLHASVGTLRADLTAQQTASLIFARGFWGRLQWLFAGR